jgi:hypothetical protein
VWRCSPWLFYGFAGLAFAAAGFRVAQAAAGAFDAGYTLGTGVFSLFALLAVAIGNAVRVMDRRLRAVEGQGGGSAAESSAAADRGGV